MTTPKCSEFWGISQTCPCDVGSNNFQRAGPLGDPADLGWRQLPKGQNFGDLSNERRNSLHLEVVNGMCLRSPVLWPFGSCQCPLLFGRFSDGPAKFWLLGSCRYPTLPGYFRDPPKFWLFRSCCHKLFERSPNILPFL